MIEKNTWVALALLFTTLTAVSAKSDLPPGVLRGPLLREHSFADPLVTDWWTEGVPHYMIGGSAVANEHFMRLTTHTLDDHGFAFNTAPMDHHNWEVRMKFSVRPPAEAARNQDELDDYQGGDGIALWYLRQPIGDDHQHVVKYSKPISAEVMTDRADKENPWRFADEILMDDNDEDELDELDDLDDLTEVEKKQMAEDKERRAVQRRRREELFRKLFKRGTSIDDDNVEPRIMGVKYSDFSGGFAIVLDSVGEEEEHTKHHHRHTSSIYLLLNLPNHTAGDVQNNFNPSRTNFRQSPKILQCAYDFRQNATKMYDPSVAQKDETTRLLQAVEQPLELVVRYHEKKLSILVIREDVSQRKIIKPKKVGWTFSVGMWRLSAARRIPSRYR
ncbi:hypothetical protein AGDE_11938 [Angomonas deanei]|nr:hypothetical protein AGDE_11938 [Angomonas deanei]|eukprot:EPY25264.1 hypothetical protein AGDE_11938 [Angomonas deanei]